MRKKSPPTPLHKTEFRESDFAGMPPQEKTQLSGALNRLSAQLANTRQLLQDIEYGAPIAGASPSSAPDSPDDVPPEASGEAEEEPPAPVRKPSTTATDDGTPVPP